MGNMEIILPESSKRLLNITGIIDETLTTDFINRLTEIDMEDMAITTQNISKLNSLGIDASTFNLPSIKVLLNSYGGYIYDALSLYDMINSRSDIVCMCTGKVMSAATFVLLGFHPDLRIATKNTTFMIHSPSSMTLGKLKEMEDDVTETRRLNKIITDIYLKNTKIPKDLLDKIYKEKLDYYFTAKEALKFGMITKII